MSRTLGLVLALLTGCADDVEATAPPLGAVGDAPDLPSLDVLLPIPELPPTDGPVEHPCGWTLGGPDGEWPLRVSEAEAACLGALDHRDAVRRLFPVLRAWKDGTLLPAPGGEDCAARHEAVLARLPAPPEGDLATTDEVLALSHALRAALLDEAIAEGGDPDGSDDETGCDLRERTLVDVGDLVEWQSAARLDLVELYEWTQAYDFPDEGAVDWRMATLAGAEPGAPRGRVRIRPGSLAARLVARETLADVLAEPPDSLTGRALVDWRARQLWAAGAVVPGDTLCGALGPECVEAVDALLTAESLPDAVPCRPLNADLIARRVQSSGGDFALNQCNRWLSDGPHDTRPRLPDGSEPTVEVEGWTVQDGAWHARVRVRTPASRTVKLAVEQARLHRESHRQEVLREPAWDVTPDASADRRRTWVHTTDTETVVHVRGPAGDVPPSDGTLFLSVDGESIAVPLRTEARPWTALPTLPAAPGPVRRCGLDLLEGRWETRLSESERACLEDADDGTLQETALLVGSLGSRQTLAEALTTDPTCRAELERVLPEVPGDAVGDFALLVHLRAVDDALEGTRCVRSARPAVRRAIATVHGARRVDLLEFADEVDLHWFFDGQQVHGGRPWGPHRDAEPPSVRMSWRGHRVLGAVDADRLAHPRLSSDALQLLLRGEWTPPELPTEPDAYADSLVDGPTGPVALIHLELPAGGALVRVARAVTHFEAPCESRAVARQVYFEGEDVDGLGLDPTRARPHEGLRAGAFLAGEHLIGVPLGEPEASCTPVAVELHLELDGEAISPVRFDLR